jgi:CO/xanthine dehydrogenase Mo-binding subunit
MTTTLETSAAGKNLFASPECANEGREKVSGRTKYTADIERPGTLWAAFTISPFAHARVLRIETSRALALEGVRAVLTAEDIGHAHMGRNLYDWPVLASGVVRFAGDRVAAVAAETREIAEHAARLIDVTYEELPLILDPEAALAPDAPLLHPDRDRYFFAAFAGRERPPVKHANVQGERRFRKGAADLAPLFAAADRVFEHRFTTPRVHAGHIEPRATLVWLDPDGTVHVISGNKGPFRLREQLAQTTGVPAERIVIESVAIGGDFGGKGLTIDEFPCYYLAKATGRPVRYVETSTEALRSGPNRHPAHITLKTAVDASGKFIAHQSAVVFAGGAYAAGKPTANLLPGIGYYYIPYHIPNAHLDVCSVYTNAAPPAHIRTPVSVQLYFGWEQHVDLIAEALGIDPLEFRLHNCVRPGDTFPTGDKIRDVNATLVLETLRRETNWGRTLPPGHGRGIALGCSKNGAGTTSIVMTLSADGSVDVLVGVPDQGVGVHTMIRRVAAAALGIDPERIAVRRGSTGIAREDPGVGGGWGTHVNGRATEDAARRLRDEITVKTGAPWHGETDLAARACADGPIQVVGVYERTHFQQELPSDYTFTALCIEVETDRDTGAFRITDAVMIVDVGTIINPIAHQGQIDGGFIYGLGNALMEEIVSDESGLVSTLSLGEYKLPCMRDIPPFRTVLVQAPDGEGPFGAKAVGEVSNIGVPAAVMNAVASALGVRLRHFPITSERIFEALAARPA